MLANLALFWLILAVSPAKAQETAGNQLLLNPTVIPGPRLSINYQITNNTKPTVTGTIDEPSAGIFVNVANQTFRGVNSGDGSWAAGAETDLADGIYDVTMNAVPLEGARISIRAMEGLVIDTAAPKMTVNSSVTNDSSPDLEGTVDDKTAVIVVDINGTVYAAVNNEDGTWVLPSGIIFPELTPGKYEITGLAGDAAGNLSSPVKSTLIVGSEEKESSSELGAMKFFYRPPSFTGKSPAVLSFGREACSAKNIILSGTLFPKFSLRNKKLKL